jgi:hypothetical protein
MSRQGIITAGQYSVELPTFGSITEAKNSLFGSRDVGLRELLSVLQLQGLLDYTPESLKPLEKWFFTAGQPAALPTGYSVAHSIGFYLGEVYCRHAGFNWIVQEFSFAKGRFEIGVHRSLLSIMLTKGITPQSTGNKRMQSLWREFKQYAS